VAALLRELPETAGGDLGRREGLLDPRHARVVDQRVEALARQVERHACFSHGSIEEGDW
jgi:hypothetical protein